MRLTLISLLILTASVGCGKSFQSCTEVCTHHHANLDPESCSGYTNLAVDACIAKCQFYVDVAGEDCSEEVHAFLDDIGGRQLSCGWWEDCSGGYDDTCDGFASTPDIGECMRAHGESSDFPDDHPDWPWNCEVTLQVNIAEIPSYCTYGVEVYVDGQLADYMNPDSSEVNGLTWYLIRDTAEVQISCPDPGDYRTPICKSEVETVDLTSLSCGSSVDVSLELQDCPDELPSAE